MAKIVEMIDDFKLNQEKILGRKKAYIIIYTHRLNVRYNSCGIREKKFSA